MSKKSHPLVDTTEPNLLEETFDYGLPPLVRFDGPVVEYIDGEPVEFDHETYRDTTWRGPDYFWMNYDHQQRFDVTSLIKPGARNTIAFRVFKSFDHGGSYDRIFLLADPPAPPARR